MLHGWGDLGPKTAKKPASLTVCHLHSPSLSLSLPSTATTAPPAKPASSASPARAPPPPR